MDNFILNIHGAFLLEYSRTSLQLDKLYEAVNSYVHCIKIESDDKKDNVHEDIRMRKLQDICFLLKLFCSEANLYVGLLTSAEDRNLTTAEETIKEKKKINITEDFNKILPYKLYAKIFTYSMIDPSKFKVGFEAEFTVTYIKDSLERSFFAIYKTSADIFIKHLDFQYNKIPDEGIIFGIVQDGYIVRAVRENQLQKQAITFRVLLIDFGEILEISKEHNLYKLPEKLQKIPGQAMFCKLTMGGDQICLENILHTKQTMRIEKVFGNMLEMIVNPTGKFKMSELSNLTESSEMLEKVIVRNTYEGTLSSTTCSDAKSIKTREQTDVLYEKPLNTGNASEAVMDSVSQDDEEVEKLVANPKTHACFKEANGKLEQTTILQNGWTKEKLFKMKIHSETPIPRVGKKIWLLVSCVVDVEKFYGQIIHKNYKDLTVEKIVNEMNDINVKSKFQMLTRPPDEFELVLAMYVDDLWYRARILQKTANANYKVFYVDYGNCSTVTYNQLRKWEDTFDRYPFQAIECVLDNVTKFYGNQRKATAYFESLVLDKPVKATVTHNVHRLHVTLQDVSGFDIGEQLCISKYAQQKPIVGPVTA